VSYPTADIISGDATRGCTLQQYPLPRDTLDAAMPSESRDDDAAISSWRLDGQLQNAGPDELPDPDVSMSRWSSIARSRSVSVTGGRLAMNA